MSWMQQREAIRRAADAGARPRISAQGSQLLPLRDNRLQSVLLTRPNGQLTRAGQFYHSITGRRPPSRQFDESQPLIRDGPNDYILTRGGARKLVRSLQPNGQYHVTKLGKAFFKDKFTEWLAHVPVIIRGRRRNGTPYERHDYLPVTALEMGLSRQNDAWSDAQVARNVKESVLRQLGQPGPDEPIYMISGEVYFLHPTNEWAYSSSSMQVIDNRVDTQIRLRQPLGALREVSYQLFAGDQILASAFEERQDMLCVPRQLAELLKLPLQEVMEDFNSIAEIRTFCVWRKRAHVLRRLQGPLAGLLPASREGGEGRRLYLLERPRLLLQKRPGRGRLRRVGAAAALPTAQAGQPRAGVQGVAVVGGRDQIGVLLHGRHSRGPGAAAGGGPPAQGLHEGAV